MPKVTGKSLPLSGLFAIDKPSGEITMKLLNTINDLLASSELFLTMEQKQNQKQKRLHKQRGRRRQGKVKLGQGGTLDPLASGVLVLGVNDGTKQLSNFLHGTKEYRVTGLLGSSTDSYDSEGKRVRFADYKHVTRESIEAVLDRFRGQIKQLPPIYSAIKMDGKPLYDYARSNTPLPRPIETRDCTIYNLELTGWKSGNEHSWTGSTKEMTKEEKETMEKLESLLKAKSEKEGEKGAETAVEAAVPEATTSQSGEVKAEESQAKAEVIATEATAEERPPVFELKMTVSSGTYVRSIVHDIAIAVNSAAHVVELVRTRQGPFALDPLASTKVDDEDVTEPLRGVVPWQVIQDGMKELNASKEKDENDMQENAEEENKSWEEAILKALH